VEECFVLHFTHAWMVQVPYKHEGAILAEVNIAACIAGVATQVAFASRHLTALTLLIF